MVPTWYTGEVVDLLRYCGMHLVGLEWVNDIFFNTSLIMVSVGCLFSFLFIVKKTFLKEICCFCFCYCYYGSLLLLKQRHYKFHVIYTVLIYCKILVNYLVSFFSVSVFVTVVQNCRIYVVVHVNQL